MEKSLIAGTVLGTILTAGGGAALHYTAQNPPMAAFAESPEGAAEAQPLLPVTDASETTQPVTTQPVKPKTPAPAFARVINVDPVEKTVQIPRQQCHDELVTHSEPVKDKHQIAGIVSGALLGGILGHQVGDGRGKDLATVAGAAAGAYGGKKTQQEIQKRRTWTTTEQRCEVVMDTKVSTTGYDVRYEINGKVARVRMDYHPGSQIRLYNGNLVI